MKKLVSTLNMPREAWLRYRKQGIGGSDAGAICGLNPYCSAMQVYYDKTTEDTEDIDNEAMRQGREMEEYVAKRFAEKTGKKVRRANAMFYDENNPFMLADVDRMVVGENAGLECKTASPFMAEYWSGDKIPLSYQMQCFHYMSVMNADAWYIAVLIYGREFKVYKLERDEEIIANLIKVERNFWENNVLKGIIPDPDGSKLADSVIAEYFKESTGAAIPLQGFDDKLKRREEIVSLMDKMESEKRQIEQELKMYMGDAEKAENQLFRVSWKAVVSNRLDAKALQEQEPEVYRKFLKQTSSRRFTVKAA
jgi:putative phage-type endonuclease